MWGGESNSVARLMRPSSAPTVPTSHCVNLSSPELEEPVLENDDTFRPVNLRTFEPSNVQLATCNLQLPDRVTGGIRTRVDPFRRREPDSARPRLLKDSLRKNNWLGSKDSNLDRSVQSRVACRLATSQSEWTVLESSQSLRGFGPALIHLSYPSVST